MSDCIARVAPSSSTSSVAAPWASRAAPPTPPERSKGCESASPRSAVANADESAAESRVEVELDAPAALRPRDIFKCARACSCCCCSSAAVGFVVAAPPTARLPAVAAGFVLRAPLPSSLVAEVAPLLLDAVAGLPLTLAFKRDYAAGFPITCAAMASNSRSAASASAAIRLAMPSAAAASAAAAVAVTCCP